MRDARVTPEARLAAAGLPPARAVPRLREAGLWDDEGPRAGTLELLDVLSEAAAPDDALIAVTDLAAGQPDRFAEVRAHEAWLRRFVAVAGASRPLGELLARHADALEGLRDPGPVDASAVADEVDEALGAAEAFPRRAAAVARIRRRLTAAIAARDLTGEAGVEQVALDLAYLAEGVLGGTLRAVHRDLAGPATTTSGGTRLCVVGMGKLGGAELNYVSDVDVIFVHDPETAREEAHQAVSALLRLLNASTTMGRAYEVDPTLRPEGRDGPLSRTVSSYVSYWQRWAKTWEFQALLKARPVAGDLSLGSELLAAAEPFVFPQRLDVGVIADVRDMKGRVETKAEVLRDGERQIKLGPGGLRDIEFSVQLLQLVHGRADRSLRVPGTLPALAALTAGGYVAEDDAEVFAAAYRELRNVEHRLQLSSERRTHTLPQDPQKLERLARSLGYRPSLERPAREPFLIQLRAVQAQVRDLHAKLFYRPLLEVHARVPAEDVGIVRDSQGLDEEAARTRLEALGFHDPAGALRDARALSAGMTRRAAVMRAVLPAMLHALSDSPDPDGGLRALRTLVEASGDDSALVAALRDQPPAADLLGRMLGTSEVVGELLTSDPQGIEWITDPARRAQPRSREALVRRALGVLGWQAGLAEREAALRRFKRRELARIVVRDLAGEAGVSLVGTELTALAEACLEAGVSAVLSGQPDAPARFAVVGLGKLGGAELHYASDLDVVFVHEPVEGVPEKQATAFGLEVAERVLEALSAVTAEGTAFEVDPELRPEGRSGPLSRSLTSYRAYYERWSQPWEHQALLKARHVAGDPEVGHEFVALARERAYRSDFGPKEVTATRKMKARIERERVPRRADPARHLKLGPGGLSDVEWTVQLLQLTHGWHDARLRTPSTMEALDAAEDAGLVEARDAQWLREGYRLLTRTRNRLFLLRIRDVDQLPTGPPLERLARSLGYGRGGRQEFEADYLRRTRHVRRVVERLFYGQEPGRLRTR